MDKNIPIFDIFNVMVGGDMKNINTNRTKDDIFKYPVYSNGVNDKGLFCFADSFKVDSESITISARGTIGACFYRNNKYTPVGRLICLTAKNNLNINLKFYYYVLSREKFIHADGAIKSLTIPMLNDIKLPGLSLKKQNKIVSILEKQESVISNIEKLILKTEKMFSYFCDNLISGKMILENNKLINNINKNNMKKYKLENFLKMYPNTKKYQIKSKDILESGTIPVISQEKEKISGYSNKKDYIMADKNNPIIVFGDHSCTLKLIDFNFILGGDGTKVFTSNNNETLFLYYLIKNLGLKTEGYKRHFSILKEKLVVDIPNKLDVCKILLNIEQLIENQKKLLEKEKQKFEWLSEKILSGEYLVVEEQE